MLQAVVEGANGDIRSAIMGWSLRVHVIIVAESGQTEAQVSLTSR